MIPDLPVWYWTAIAVTSTVFIVLGPLLLYEWYKKRRNQLFSPPALTEWRRTGGVDMAPGHPDEPDENKPDIFVLMTEEKREVANIAGGPVTEIRWRYATRAEAKDAVRRLMTPQLSAGQYLPEA